MYILLYMFVSLFTMRIQICVTWCIIFEIQHAICITDVLRILHRCFDFASIILGPLGFLQTGETVVPFGRFSFGMFIVLVAWFPTGRRRVFSLGLPVYWENTWMTYQERPSTGVVSQSYSVFFWTFDFVSCFWFWMKPRFIRNPLGVVCRVGSHKVGEQHAWLQDKNKVVPSHPSLCFCWLIP